MRPLCDVCERAAAKLFCAADEAALCISCDEKVHLCNKLANRHVRVGLADPNDVPRCDICEKAPAFFYCEIDGTSLCLQCDMTVHVGGKRTHGRYLLFRQRVECPGDLLPARLKDPGMQPNDPPTQTTTRRGNELNHRTSTVPMMEPSIQFNGRMDIDNQRVDLNSRPNQPVEEVSITRGMGSTREGNDEAVSVVPVGSFKHP